MDIKNLKEIDEAIVELERRKIIQQSILKQQFGETVNHYKPINLLKTAIKNTFDGDPNTGASGLLKTAGGIGAGLLAKKFVFSTPTGIVGKLASSAIKAGALKAVFENKDKITAWGTAIYKNLFTKKHKDITY